MNYITLSLIFAGTTLAIAATLFFVMRAYMSRLVDRRIAAYQNDLVVKHCDEVENIYRQMRGWRHDFHNHIQAMKALYTLERADEIPGYLDKLDADLQTVDTVVKTGNVMVDAILNSKLSLAVSRKIAVNAKASVPGTLKISEIDLCVALGNLMDNAMEACMKLAEPNRFLRVYIGTHKQMLYVSVTNATGGDIRKSGRTYISTKNSPSHGFGLLRIDRIAAKYGGFVNRQHEEGVFATELSLPL